MSSGILYIHGRAKNFAPIMVLDLVNLGDMLEKKEIDPPMFMNLMNFVCTYMI
jgi:hypothetical protein